MLPPERERTYAEEWAGLAQVLGLVRRHAIAFFLCLTIFGGIGLVLAQREAPTFESSVVLGLPTASGTNSSSDALELSIAHLSGAEALARLQSNAVLSLVVESPAANPLANEPSGQGEPNFRMGLTTQVQTLPSSIWRRLAFWKSPPRGTLRAQFVGESPWESLGGARDVTITFETDSTAWIVSTDALESQAAHFLGFGLGPHARRISAVLGERIELKEGALELWAEGSLAGQSFRIRERTQEEAIADLRAAVRVQGPTPQSNTLRIEVRDTQATRAQEIAQALADAFQFQLRAQAKADTQAREAVIREQLWQRKQALQDLEERIAARQADNPDLLQPERSLEALSHCVLAAEQEHSERQARLQALQAAAAGVQAYEREALASAQAALREDHIDRWVQALDQLDSQSLGNDHSELTKQWIAFQEDWERAKRATRDAQHLATEFERHLQHFEAGEPGGLTALVHLLTEGRYQAPTALVDTEIKPYRNAQTELAKLTERYTHKHPEVQGAKLWLQTREASLKAALQSQLSVLVEEVQAKQAEQTLWEQLVAQKPKDSQSQREQAKAALWERLQTGITAGTLRLQAQQDEWASRLATAQERLRRLPLDQQALQEPRLESAGLRDQIQNLIAKRERVEWLAAAWKPLAEVLEPAHTAKLRQPKLAWIGAFAGLLCGWLIALGWAQFRIHAGGGGQTRMPNRRNAKVFAPPGDVPVLAHWGASVENQTTEKHTSLARMNLHKLRVQLDLCEQRGLHTALLGIFALQDESEDEEPTRSPGLNTGEGSLPTPSAHIVRGLAAEYLETGKSVVIVDAVGGPHGLSRSMGQHTAAGLHECLQGQTWWRSNLVSAPDERLQLLPIGGKSLKPAQMLGSLGWDHMMLELAEAFDVVLVHLPPLETHPELRLLAPKLDGVVLVADAREEQDPWRFADWLAPLRMARTQILGQVRVVPAAAQAGFKRSA